MREREILATSQMRKKSIGGEEEAEGNNISSVDESCEDRPDCYLQNRENCQYK